MTDSKNDKTVTRKMNVTFGNEDEYKKFVNGETYSDKGIRTNNGRFGYQPDIEIIDEAEGDSDSISEFDYQQEYLRASEKYEENDGIATAILKAIIEGLVEGVGEGIIEVLSDEEKREILASMVGKWWHGKVIFVKKTWSIITEKVSSRTEIIRSGFSGKTKAEKLLSERKELTKTTEPSAANSAFFEPDKDISDKYREIISREEAQQQYDQIKVLAILLADKIKKLSNAHIRECDMSPEDCLIRQNTIEELTTQEVMNSIKLLLENDSFFLDNSTSRVFSEFLAGNLIVGDSLVPIENYRVKELLRLRNIADGEKNDE